MDLRNEHIGLGVCFAILIAAGLATEWGGASDAVGHVAGIVAFFTALAVSSALNERDYRRGKRRVRR